MNTAKHASASLTLKYNDPISGQMPSVISVSELNERARSVMSADASLNDVWVSGEISNLTKHTSGHYYFTLKDAKSEVRCTLFKGARNTLQFDPSENMKVAAFGSVDLYVARGSYQFNVVTMRRSGIGDMYLALEELKKKLKEEGLFEQSRKRAIPKYPRIVGIVTSPTGAAIHDIIKVAAKRFPADLLLAPVLVQGEGAAASIAKGIELMNTMDIDVLIVGRGGGSAEDLWAFNEEKVARAIAASRIPIISAVGHETDFTVADMVADVRAPTPSAAAEIALPDVPSELRNIENMMIRASGLLYGTVVAMKNDFKALDSKLSLKRAKEAVSQYVLKLDDLSSSADSALLRAFADKKKDHASAEQRMNAISPLRVLERGYSYVTDGCGKALVSVSQIRTGSEVGIRMRDGTAIARINEVSKK